MSACAVGCFYAVHRAVSVQSVMLPCSGVGIVLLPPMDKLCCLFEGAISLPLKLPWL